MLAFALWTLLSLVACFGLLPARWAPLTLRRGTMVVQVTGDNFFNDRIFHLQTTTAENLTLKLYKTNVTPIKTNVAGDFTVADFTGYSDVTLTNTSWGSSSTVSSQGQTTYAQQTWTNTGSAQTIYGYYVVGATTGTIYFAELFAASRTLNTNDVLKLTPVFNSN